MEQITSVNNQKVKGLVQLQQKSGKRRQAKSFVIEGIRLFQDAPEAFLEEVYVSEHLYEDLLRKEAEGDGEAKRMLARILQMEQKKSAYLVTDEVLAKAADTKTPQGVLAKVKMPSWTLDQMLGGSRMESTKPPMLLILEDVQDPGNLGTMFRTAEAAGANGVIMSKETVDLFNPKAVRSTMSAIFRVPYLYAEDLLETMKELKKRDIQMYAAYLEGSVPYDAPDYTKPCAFLIGNEGKGLREKTAMTADARIRIPMQGEIESLNAAMSAGIVMYEAFRQRRKVG